MAALSPSEVGLLAHRHKQVRGLVEGGAHQSAVDTALHLMGVQHGVGSEPTSPNYGFFLESVQLVADTLFAAGQYRRADLHYQRVLDGLQKVASGSTMSRVGVDADFGNPFSLQHKRAQCFHKLGDNGEALAVLQHIPPESRSCGVHLLMARLCDLVGDMRDAVMCRMAALRANPYATEVLEPLAHSGASAREILACLSASAKLPAEDAAWLQQLAQGHIAAAQYKYKPALECFSALSVASPANVGYTLQTARVHAAMDDYEPALRKFEQVQHADAACVDFMDEFASCLHRRSCDASIVAAGDSTAGPRLSQLAHSMLAIDKQRPEAWVIAAIAAFVAESGDATQLLDTACRIDGAHVHAMLVKSGIHMAAGAFSRAAMHFLKVIAKRRSFHAHKGLVTACIEVGKTKEALQRARQAQSVMPNDPRALVMLGQVLMHTDAPDAMAQAIRMLNKALEVDPGCVEARLALADAHAQDGNTDEAVRLLSSNTDPTKQTFADYKLALIFMDAGQYDDALAHFHRTLAANPDFAAAQEGLERLEKLTRGEDPDAEVGDDVEDSPGEEEYAEYE